MEMADFLRALLGFIFNAAIFVGAFLAAWIAWIRDNNYRLRMTAAKECLLAYYSFSEAYAVAMRGPQVTYGPAGKKSPSKEQVLEKQ